MNISRGSRANTLDSQGRQYQNSRRVGDDPLATGRDSRNALYKSNTVGQEFGGSRYASYNPVRQGLRRREDNDINGTTATMTEQDWLKVGLITSALIAGITVIKNNWGKRV